MTRDPTAVAALTVWGEARGEPDAGKRAVAWVIRNRAASPGWWGADVESVCRKPGQFSCWNEGDPNRDGIERLADRDPVYLCCLEIVREVMAADPVRDPTRGASHYHARGIEPPFWAIGHEPSAAIGNHLFYNDVE
jgi:spore germination cell wall hydrolase CwlJ-like protein